jgi:UDP-N-acetylmuramate--alanine ligase
MRKENGCYKGAIRLEGCKDLFFLGIGGTGMYGVARLAHDLGFRVCGTDARESSNTERLRRAGIAVTENARELPLDTDALIYTLAVREEHPLLREARRRGIPTVSRAEALGELMLAFPKRVAIAGAHGKSSTVGMCAEILKEAGKSPTVLVGADLSPSEGGYRRGTGDIILLEACEYKDSFLFFSPTHAAVLNAEWEHTDYFPNEESVYRSFRRFLAGESVCCRITPAHSPFQGDITFGKGGDVSAQDTEMRGGCACFSLTYRGKKLASPALRIIGAHQRENALAAAALCLSLGIDAESIARGLSVHRGVGGRLERCERLPGLYLDYAHHPTELSCALTSARMLAPRVVCVFEPHTFSRLFAFYNEFKALLTRIDPTGILPIYPARETQTMGMSSKRLAEECGAVYLPTFSSAAEFLRENVGEDTVLLLVGAGRVGDTLSFL